MHHVWWRTHLRRLPELAGYPQFGSFDEVDETIPFLVDAMGLSHGGRVLDLGCGRGGFSIRLTQWGYEPVGVEESEELLAAAREAAREHQVEVDFRRADLRALTERSAFDAAMALDFGGFSDLDNAEVMRSVATALKPGGRVVLGVCNPYYWARGPHTEHRTLGGIDVISRYRFDFTTGTLVSRVRCILPGGQRRDLPAGTYRAYTWPELRALTAAAGLADLQVWGQDETGRTVPEGSLDNLRTPFFHCVALRPVRGQSGEGI